MGEFLWFAVSALWLGILTSISPCPLATNIAAMSFVGRRVGKLRRVFLAGTLYTFGRALAYTVLGYLLVASVLSIPNVSFYLQIYMNKILGPVLILVGMVLLEFLSFNFSGPGFGDRLKKLVERMDVWGAGLLGVVFALSFCPVSAALFFGSLLTIAVSQESGLLLPAVYGVGTGLPVLLFAGLLSLGANRVGLAFDKLTAIEVWARRITGAIFILVGIYYCLMYIFQVF